MNIVKPINKFLFSLGSTFVGLIFLIFAFSNPVLAIDPSSPSSIPSETTSTDSPQESQTSQETQTSSEQGTVTQTSEHYETISNVCEEESDSLSWVICSTVNFLSKVTDGVYDAIEDFLVVEPLSFDTSNPFHQVWLIFRNFTNVIFIIFFMIIILSQLTGIGISNYGIKRALPKIVVAAILINLSYIICALLVDVSNIIGASLRTIFTSVESGITPTGLLASASASSSSDFSYAAVASIFSGSTLFGGFAIGLAGGLKYVFYSFIPVLLSAIVAVVIAYITIAARQALVYLLIMISPLAFVCMLLPNTETWYKKWQSTLTSMLFFYPTFSFLFGVCSLVSWVIVAAAERPLFIVFGLAIKIVPLILSWKLLKMSNTLPGQINSFLTNLSSRPLGAVKNYTTELANARRAEYTARQMRRPFNPASGGSWRVKNIQTKSNLQDRLNTAENIQKGYLEEELIARREGRKIIGRTSSGAPIYKTKITGYDSDHRPIYSPTVAETAQLHNEYTLRELKLRNTSAQQRLDNSMSTMSTYLKQNSVEASPELAAHMSQQLQNYFEYNTQLEAKRRNELADKRFYANAVKTAGLRNEAGEIIDRAAYDRLITRAAGSDAYIDPSVTDPNTLRELETYRSAALASVQADAIDALETERKVVTAKYTTYLGKQITKEVLRNYKQMLESKDIEGIVAAQNTLAMRGDYDKIVSNLHQYLDRDGYLELGTDFSNVLASNLLSMKGADPELARLGKHINVETWNYTSGGRRSNFVTYKEFMTGKTSEGEDTKYFIESLFKGTGVKEIDRTFYSGLSSSMDEYLTIENYGSAEAADAAREQLMTTMLPQIISALPGFTADSEQILNTLNFLTGMKNKNGKWKIDRKDSDDDATHARKQVIYDRMTEKYLKGLTASDLIGLKTNTFDAILTRYMLESGYNPEAAADSPSNIAAKSTAEAKLRKILEPQIRALRTGDQAQLASMKTKIRTALGLL